MAERILVPYDRSVCADTAVEAALRLAREQNASLYVLAMTPDEPETTGPIPVASQLNDDLIAFVRLGSQMGVRVDGSYLEAPTVELIREAMVTHRIDHLVVANCETQEKTSANGRMLRTLTTDSPVPTTVLG
jgi:nucleotide-binding universal stress UspA family protein